MEMLRFVEPGYAYSHHRDDMWLAHPSKWFQRGKVVITNTFKLH